MAAVKRHGWRRGWSLRSREVPATIRPLMSGSGRLSVLVPVYNEVGTVRALLDRVRDVPLRKEVIVVDDGSSDGTHRVLAEYRDVTPDTPECRLVLLRHDRNLGKG